MVRQKIGQNRDKELVAGQYAIQVQKPMEGEASMMIDVEVILNRGSSSSSAAAHGHSWR